MTLPEEFTVPEAAAFLNVNEETVRRNIRAKRLSARRIGTQWFILRDVLVLFANLYDPKDTLNKSLKPVILDTPAP